MKKTLIFAASALLLAACNGNKDLAPEQIGGEANLVEYSFKVGAETKAAISDAGVFSWAAGDEIAVWDAQNNKFDKFTADSDGASTTISGLGAPDADYTKAFYPYAAAASETSVAWPDSYASAADAAKGFPMMALNESGTLNFKHLGALLKISINDLPAGVTSLVFNGVGVSGTLPVDETDPAAPFCALGSSASSITLPTAAVAGDAVFYLPLPVGTLTGGFSIDFKITSTNNKVVGTKATTSNVSIARGKLIPMKAFTPEFNWPSDTDAFDYGVAKNASKKAEYPSADRKTDEIIAVYGENGFQSGSKIRNQAGYLSSVTLDKITYTAHYVTGSTYHTMTFNGNRFDTSGVRGPREWVNESEYGKVIPADLCFSWKVNRPGKFNYACIIYSKKTDRSASYKLAILKTVDGVTSAKTLIDFTPDQNLVDDRATSGVTHPIPECYQEFEVTAEDLLGIDEAATLYFYGYEKKNYNLQVSHYPITWTPSVAQ